MQRLLRGETDNVAEVFNAVNKSTESTSGGAIPEDLTKVIKSMATTAAEMSKLCGTTPDKDQKAADAESSGAGDKGTGSTGVKEDQQKDKAAKAKTAKAAKAKRAKE